MLGKSGRFGRNFGNSCGTVPPPNARNMYIIYLWLCTDICHLWRRQVRNHIKYIPGGTIKVDNPLKMWSCRQKYKDWPIMALVNYAPLTSCLPPAIRPTPEKFLGGLVSPLVCDCRRRGVAAKNKLNAILTVL